MTLTVDRRNRLLATRATVRRSHRTSGCRQRGVELKGDSGIAFMTVLTVQLHKSTMGVLHVIDLTEELLDLITDLTCHAP